MFFIGLFFLSKNMVEYETQQENKSEVKQMKCASGKCGKSEYVKKVNM